MSSQPLRKARLIAGQSVLDLMPCVSTALLVLSCVASFRLPLSKYEVRRFRADASSGRS